MTCQKQKSQDIIFESLGAATLDEKKKQNIDFNKRKQHSVSGYA